MKGRRGLHRNKREREGRKESGRLTMKGGREVGRDERTVGFTSLLGREGRREGRRKGEMDKGRDEWREERKEEIK